MARMYPTQVPARIQAGEEQVFRALQELPDEWVVLHDCWEHYKERHYYVNYEADFIVLIPGLGMVVIEVKDWPHVMIKNGEWWSKGKSDASVWTGMGHKNSPLNQAFLASKKLVQGLVKRGIFAQDTRKQPEVRSLAILTNCVPDNPEENATAEDRNLSNKHHLPLSTLYICGREALENKLQERLEQLFVNKGKKGELMTPALVQEIEEHLAPSLLFRMDFSNYTETMANAGSDLFRVLPRLEESRGGIRVDGCAGSGKTEMALREARRLADCQAADSDCSILLLCYNNNLAHRLQRGINNCRGAERITISGFHDYCIEHVIRPAGRDDLIIYDKQTPYLDDTGWEWLAHNLDRLPRHQYIFVDEAQDFKPSWWDIVRAMLEPGGKLYIFADIHQDIYRHSQGLPDLPTRVRLTRNLRNSWKITTFSSGILPAQMHPLPLSGAPVLLSNPSDSPHERAAEVRRILQELRNHPQYRVLNRDIVVLSPWRAANPRCCFPYCEELDFADGTENAEEAATRHERCRRGNSNLVLADTIKSFKGLESPFVILTDICADDESRGFSAADFYVACTRARFGLYIIPTCSGFPMAERILNRTRTFYPPEASNE